MPRCAAVNTHPHGRGLTPHGVPADANTVRRTMTYADRDLIDLTGDARVAFLFPGQGSQTPTMRDDVERWCPELADRAARALGVDPFERLDDGTRFLQPAVFCASIAGWRRLMDAGARECDIAGIAGHSLGELAALVAGGSLTEEEALDLVVLRGRLMDAEVSAVGDGGMLAILGGDNATLAAMADRHGVTIANDNAPGQVVVSGPLASLQLMKREARGRALKAIRLPIRGAFHSPAMAPIVDDFRAAVAAVAPRPPAVPVFSCVTAAPFDDIPRELADGLVHGVRWRDTLRALHESGATWFVEAGPGKVLTKLVWRTLAHAQACSSAELGKAYV